MSHFPTLETERLRLNALKATDIPTIVQLANNVNIARYTRNLPYPYFEKDAIFWLNLAHQGIQDGSKLVLAIREKASDDFMGGIGLHINEKHQRAELGYWIGEPFWGKGYVTEAAKAMIEYAFDGLDLNRVQAHHMKANVGSGRVMQKAGLFREGELVEHELKSGVYHSLMVYGLTRQQRKQSHNL